MIISASRRTDILAFYSQWFINRIRAGYCTVPNPFNRKQVSCVSLAPEDVDVIVFWTRNPRPFFEHLEELHQLGYRYYFQFTLMDNPRAIEKKTPALSTALETFQTLSDLVGPERVIWRYDPIVFSKITGVQFPIDTYRRIVQALRGYTQRSVVSVVDIYAKARKRLRELEAQGAEILDYSGQPSPNFDTLMRSLAEIAGQNHMEILSCVETVDLHPYGIRPGKCIYDAYIEKVFGIEVSHKKDPYQRDACGCIQSKDIGIYNTCLFEC